MGAQNAKAYCNVLCMDDESQAPPFPIPIPSAKLLPKDSYLLEMQLVEVQGVANLPDDLTAIATLVPDQSIEGSQYQEAKAKTERQSGSAVWESQDSVNTPGHLFQFVVDSEKINLTKVFLSIRHGKRRDPVGDLLIVAKDLLGQEPRDKRYALRDPQTNRRIRNKTAEIKVFICPKVEAFPGLKEIYYSYERYNEELGWGCTEKHFYHSDMGKWSTADQKKWAFTFDEILEKSPATPEPSVKIYQGSRANSTSGVPGGPSGGEGGGGGGGGAEWEYAEVFRHPGAWEPDWRDGALRVRRRPVVRVTKAVGGGPPPPHSHSHRSTDTHPPPPDRALPPGRALCLGIYTPFSGLRAA